MPELPEVEVSRQGITPYVVNQTISQVRVRDYRLRWPIPRRLPHILTGLKVVSITRRGKYLLFDCGVGSLILHLGMSGHLRILPEKTAATAHDHVDIVFANGKMLRFNDPRRFGALLWTTGQLESHPRLCHLGPEPLSEYFTAATLYEAAQKRRCPVKTLIMNAEVVVGVGNIYANESLFRARIDPFRACYRISKQRYQRLVQAIREILQQAIQQGGTTLNDFLNSDGKPGYFAQTLQVYGRADQPCLQCQRELYEKRLNGRSTVYCRYCQR